jgi:hypothetical protein
MTYAHKSILSLMAASMLLTACNSHAIPPATSPAFSTGDSSIVDDVDTTSILKKLKKNVTIGSTVDPTNGDQGPRGLAWVAAGSGALSKGQLLFCDFEDKSGAAGKGTSVDKIDSKSGSKPGTFAQNVKSAGCADDSLSPASDDVYTAGVSSHVVARYSPSGKLNKTWGKPLVTPFSVVDAACVGGAVHCGYSAEPVFTSDATTGAIVVFSANQYGIRKPTAVISGFAVNKKSGWSALGPSGLTFNTAKKGTLFVVDGVDDTVVSINNATELLAPGEIIVLKGGKTFKCKYKKTTCGTLVHAGTPLAAPVAMTLLPNGNLIAANTQGGDMLVEMTPTGKILATKLVDKSKTGGIFGLRAIGKTDNDTVLYYTDRNDNSVHELEP